VTYLDAAFDCQRTLAVRRQISRHHIAKIRDEVGLGQVTAPVDTFYVKVFFVGPTDPVGHDSDLAVGHELTLDYGGFVVNYDEPFVCACGAAACRGRVTRHDWRALARSPGSVAPFVRRRLAAE
jgi:hypothetical protein